MAKHTTVDSIINKDLGRSYCVEDELCLYMLYEEEETI
jgi:hypothetical protein